MTVHRTLVTPEGFGRTRFRVPVVLFMWDRYR